MPTCPVSDVQRVNTRSAGLTLIELLVVIAIVAILSAIAMPSFVGTTQKYRAIGEINSFSVDLQFARSEALRRGVSIVMCASLDGATCSGKNNWEKGWITGTDPAAGAIIVLRKQPVLAGTDTLRPSGGTTAVLFNRDGFAGGLANGKLETFVAKPVSGSSSAVQCVSISSVGRQQKLTYGGACQ